MSAPRARTYFVALPPIPPVLSNLRAPKSPADPTVPPTPVTPLESALIDTHRVLTEIDRNSPVPTLAESAVTDAPLANPLEYALTKKGGGGGIALRADSEDPHPPTPLSAGSPSRRRTTWRRSSAWSAPTASAPSAGTGTGALSSVAPAAPLPGPARARLCRGAAKNIPTVAATSESLSPDSCRAR